MPRKSQAKPKWIGIVGAVGYGLFLVLALAVGTVGGWVRQSPLIVTALTDHRKPDEIFNQHTLTVLVLGCDEDLAPGGKKVLKKQARSDMMLVAKFDFDRRKITGVSIPRDTQCQLPGYHLLKINAYHSIAKKGNEAELTKEAVEHILPIHIDRVITLDFDAFQKMVNEVGGVTVDVKKKMHYTDRAGNLFINFKPGVQHLDGYNAMCYVRFRHGDSDFVREERQREFMMDLKQQALDNILNAPQVVNDAVAVLGNSMTDAEVASLAKFVRDVGPQSIDLGQIPVVDATGSDVKVDEEKLPAVLTHYGLIDDPTTRVSLSR